MRFILRDELTTTPPKLTLTSLHHLKPPQETPGAKTPPFQPMVSVPFQWEEAPGRPKPKPNSSPSPSRPNCSRCLQLPPAPTMLSSKVANDNIIITSMHHNSTTREFSDGPCFNLGRSLSQRSCSLGPSPNILINHCTCKGDEVISHVENCKWANDKAQKWNGVGSTSSHVDIEVKITRFKRSKRSLYELTHKSSRLFENIYQSLKQLARRRERRRS